MYRSFAERICALLLVISCLASVAHCAAAQGTVAQPGTISGTVRDAQGKPVTGASVSLQKNGTDEATVTTHTDGAFIFRPRSVGPYVVSAEKSGGGTSSTAFTISRDEQKIINLTLPRAPLEAANIASTEIQLSDQPNFTVAGITDPSAAGGHGSDASLRTSESLAKDTASLKSDHNNLAATSAEDLSRARDNLRTKLQTANTGENHRRLGDIYEKLNDPLNAVREYETAARLDPGEQNYFSWGAELLLHHAVQPALEVFSKGSAAHPKSARMLAGLGAAQYASGSNDRAARSFCEASDLDPENATPYLFLGKLEKALPDAPACAEPRLARFAAQQPQNPMASYYYAIALLKPQSGATEPTRSQKAEELLKKSLAADPSNADAHLQLGILFSTRKDEAAAIAAFQKALQLNPDLAEAHYRLGRALKQTGDDAGAQEEFQAYRDTQKKDAAEFERQRRELQQFVIVLKDQPTSH